MIYTLEETVKRIKDYKSQNKKIVFTNGCFDIIHAGHVKYLNIAKTYGDILIVGLNSDNSIKRIKGDKRPIVPQEEFKTLQILWVYHNGYIPYSKKHHQRKRIIYHRFVVYRQKMLV